MELIKVTEKEGNKFIGTNFIGPERGIPVYGGQTTAQALSAASKNIPENYSLQTLFVHFHRPAFTAIEMVYAVEVVREGKTTINKRVTGYQNNKIVLIVDVVFSLPCKSLEFQCKENKLYAKEYENLEVYIKNNLSNENSVLPPELLKSFNFLLKFEKYFQILIASPKENSFRRELKIVLKENYEDKIGILVFLSDLFLMEAPLLIFKKHLKKGFISFITTSHHNIYFHELKYQNEVSFYYVIDCIRLVNGVALCEGYLLDSKKNHIFTAVQEITIKQES